MTWADRLPLTAAATSVVAAVALLGGCVRSVEVAPGAAGSGDACATAAARFPATVAQQQRREVSGPDGGPSPATAAWGDPAIVARCGVPALEPTAAGCVDVDGVGWVPEQLTDGIRLTTFGTDPALEVLVPAGYGPGPLVLPAFDEAARTLPTNGLRCR